MSELLTPADLAAHFKVDDERTILEWTRRYSWPHIRAGRRFRWTPEQVAQIERLQTVTPEGVKAKDGRTARSARRTA